MKTVSISNKILTACPDLQVAVISACVVNSESDLQLWKEISAYEATFRSNFKIEEVNKQVPIRATRLAYKALGKDPNRYRPSSEALCRRILRGLPLYKINTLVDLINLVSLKSGYSIGGFDEDKIQGNLILGVGEADEIYHGIGRGILNIEGLPVYRDEISGIGTPTSDEERTKIELDTTHLLMIINGYSGNSGLKESVIFSIDLLKRYVSAETIECKLIKKGKTFDLLLSND